MVCCRQPLMQTAILCVTFPKLGAWGWVQLAIDGTMRSSRFKFSFPCPLLPTIHCFSEWIVVSTKILLWLFMSCHTPRYSVDGAKECLSYLCNCLFISVFIVFHSLYLQTMILCWLSLVSFQLKIFLPVLHLLIAVHFICLAMKS